MGSKLTRQEIYFHLSLAMNGQVAGKAIFRKRVFPEKFMVHEVNRGVYKVLEVFGDQEVRYVNENAVTAAIVKFTESLSANQSEYKLDEAGSRSAKNYWLRVSKPFSENILPVLQKSEVGWTFKRLDFDAKPHPTPVFDDLLSCVEINRSALLAFFGSLFDPAASRQLYLWMHGDGGDGKGALCRFFRRIFGDAFVALNSEERTRDKFFTSKCIGKRLGAFQDCHNLDFVNSETFMNLSGGDSIPVEFKGENSYSAEIDTMFLFSSNDPPVVTSKRAHLRRAIIVRFHPRTSYVYPKNVFEDLLWEERAGILSACLEKWATMKNQRGEIEFDREVTADIAAEHETKFSSTLERFFEIGQGLSEKPNDVFAVLSNGAKFNHKTDVSSFYRWLERSHGIKVGKKRPRQFDGIGIRSEFDSLRSSFRADQPF